MLNRLIPYALKMRRRAPWLFYLMVRVSQRLLPNRLGTYPRILGNEVEAVTGVLRGAQWNMAYGRGLVHERLEAEFADYVGTPFAVAVGSGGVALQMSMRVLGLRPGDEVIHQIDTCSATAMAVINAGATPVFADISPQTFMLDLHSVEAWSSPATKAIIATHMWGNPERIGALRALAQKRGWHLIEDACLGLGAVVEGRPAGSLGDTAVFSFGCVKPIQAGEGGMIAVHDEGLARELRTMRHWGDRTIEYGTRDVHGLAWNGRMSEIVAAVVREQLRGYPAHLTRLRDSVSAFEEFTHTIPGLELVTGAAANIRDAAYTQVVARLDERILGIEKSAFWRAIADRGVQLWHANFEPINSLRFFKADSWREWILRGDVEHIARNYAAAFPACQRVYDHAGIGFGKMNFLSRGNREHLQSSISAVIAEARRR